MNPHACPDPMQEHAAMRQALHAACCAVIAGEVEVARSQLDSLAALQAAHIRYEEDVLLPRLPPQPRWRAGVYRAEHRKLETLLRHIRAQWRMLPSRVEDPGQRLALLDALHPLRHVAEHHFAREEQALFSEITEASP